MLLGFIDRAAWSRSVQRLENVNRTHVVLASGILLLQKNFWGLELCSLCLGGAA